MSKSEYFENLYRLHPWIEDPFTSEGFKRYQDTVNEFKVLAKHKWLKELLKRKQDLKIVDLCSGTGIGGVSLAKTLIDLGVKVSLTFIDLRLSALSNAVKFCEKELGFEPRIVVYDVLELSKLSLERTFDIALMWGLTTPHFGPWEWIKLLSNTSKILVDDGFFIYDEADRTYSIFYLVGYKEFLPELVEKDRVVVTLHKAKEFKSGYFSRLVLDMVNGEREEMKVYFWDLASSTAFAWIFFNDVDYIPTRKPYKGIVIARDPRRKADLEISYSKTPSLLAE